MPHVICLRPLIADHFQIQQCLDNKIQLNQYIPGKLDESAKRTRLLTELGARESNDVPWPLALFEFDEITAWFSLPTAAATGTVHKFC